jgi:inosine-uridine nucleoside N-ribohydrolase
MIRLMIFSAFAIALLSAASGPGVAAPPPPPNIIFDTDMTGDVDDVGALAVLNKLADGGECHILACVTNDRDKAKAVAAAIDAINTYYGRPHIPIGTYHGPGFGPIGSPYTAALRDEFPHTVLPDDQEPDSIEIYRKALAAAPDQSVKIVSVGFLINLENLLKSQPDAASPLSGVDLVKKMVKELVVMGGQYPSSGAGGEYNFGGGDGGPHTQYVVENWPTPILFSGFEIGGAIVTSTKLASAPANDPVRRAYELFNHFAGRPSWDLTAVLAAVRDPELYWTVNKDGYCKVELRGSNTWTPTPHRGHSYLVTKVPPADVAALLDGLLGLPPHERPAPPTPPGAAGT